MNELVKMIDELSTLMPTNPAGPVESNIPTELDNMLKMVGSMLGPEFGFIMGDFHSVFDQVFKDIKIVKKVSYDPRITFSYYGKTGFSNGHKGIIVIASVIDEERGVIHYGTAFCSPKDIYDKAKGKELAYFDLVNNMTTIALRKKTHHAVNAGIFCDLVASGAYPTWAKKMVAKWTVKHVKAAMLPKKKDKLMEML